MQFYQAPTISIKNLHFAYDKKTLFKDLNLTLPAGKWLGLLGVSGVGKSSLLRLIAGINPPQENYSGNISSDNAVPLHQQIAYMAQTDLLLPWLNVLANALLGVKLRGQTSHFSALETRAKSLLTQVGLVEAMHLYPHQLSGGMRQRVALVRTLLEDKPVILMDEPFSALDTITRYNLQTLAAELLKNRTVLFVTHDPLEALRLADEIYLLAGSPAILQKFADLTSQTPRDLASPEIIHLEAKLFAELAKAAGGKHG